MLMQPPFHLCDTQGHQNQKNEKSKLRSASSTSTSLPPPSAAAAPTTTVGPLSAISLPSFDQVFEGVVRLLQGRKNIIVLVGAGISTSCGIPDFRSKDHGLYNQLNVEALGLSCPEELFCLDFFQENPLPFYQFAKHLYFPLGTDKKVEPSDSHKLLALLEEHKMLLRVYS
jgi:NAD+-dependent protein deacetylase SIR2